MGEKPEGDAGEIKVTDRRRFTGEGEPRGTEDAAKAKEAEPRQEAPEERAEKADAKALPPIDFATFVLSLATSAQVHLGVVPNPATGGQKSDLGAARQTIDILGILQEKTKGNLTDEEARLLKHLLYDLRMIYVEKSSQ